MHVQLFNILGLTTYPITCTGFGIDSIS